MNVEAQAAIFGCWKNAFRPLFQTCAGALPVHTSMTTIRFRSQIVSSHYVISEMQCLSQCSIPRPMSKGDAYEELVACQFARRQGSVFRSIAKSATMAVRMAMGMYDTVPLTRLKVLDCCCGSGGYARFDKLNNLNATLLAREQGLSATRTSPEQKAKDRIQKVMRPKPVWSRPRSSTSSAPVR